MDDWTPFAFPPHPGAGLSTEIPTSEPTILNAGDSWRWDKALADYPASDEWALSYVLLGAASFPIAGANRITVDGDGWQIRVPASATENLAAGSYQLAGYVTKGEERFEIYRGRVTVAANLAVIADGRSTAERELAIVEAAIAGRLTADLESYQVQGRAVNKIPMEMLQSIRGKLRAQVYRERTGRLGPRVEVRF